MQHHQTAGRISDLDCSLPVLALFSVALSVDVYVCEPFGYSGLERDRDLYRSGYE